MASTNPVRLLITGAAGNLGRKLIGGFLDAPWCAGIVALDREQALSGLPDTPRLRLVPGDLTDRDGAWGEALASVDAVVHLAARNPYPDASWADSAASVDMTFNLLRAAAQCGAKRLVFASSNHVMGGYKETPLARQPGAVTTGLEPLPGTRWRRGGTLVAPAGYAAAKLMGERLCAGFASHGGLTAVSLRIGWCQPGENRPQTINASGVPDAAPDESSAEGRHDLFWFRSMWLSNRDFVQAVAAALLADAGHWPSASIVVNAVSANAGMAWEITSARDLIGYEPRDDVWRDLEPGH